MKNNKRQNKKYIIVISGIILIVSVVTASILMLSYIIEKSLYAERKQALSEVVYSSAKTVNENISSEWKLQKLFEGIVCSHLHEYDSLEDFIDSDGNELDFGDDMFFLVDKTGKYYSSDGKTGVIADVSHFTSDTEDEIGYLSTLPHLDPNITYLIFRSRLPESIISSYNGKEVEIAYCAIVHNLDPLNETISTLFKGANNTFIFERLTGSMLYKQFGLKLLIDGYNLYPKFEAAELPYGEKPDDLINMCKNGKTLVAQLVINNAKYYVASTSLDINDWGLFFVVSEDYFANASVNGFETVIISIAATAVALGTLAILLVIKIFKSREQKREEKIKKAGEVIDYFTDNYMTVLIVDISSDEFQTLKNPIESYSNSRYFSEASEKFINKEVYHLDREKLVDVLNTKKVSSKLKTGDNISVEYRQHNNNNNLSWCEVQITKTADNRLITGFSINDDSVSMRKLSAVVFDDYNLIFEANLDINFIKEVKNEDNYYLNDAKTSNLSEKIKSFASGLEGEYKDFWTDISDINKLKKYLGESEKREYIYEYLTENGSLWAKCSFYVVERNEDPVTVVLAFSYLDDDQIEKFKLASILAQQKIKLEEKMRTISGLATEYLALYRVNLSTDKYEKYTSSATVKDSENNKECFSKAMSDYISLYVHPEDINKLLRYTRCDDVREILNNKKSDRFTFRAKIDNKWRWIEQTAVKEEKIEEPANIVIFGYADRDIEINKELKRQRELENALSMAQSANRAKTTFLNNMSHDIRTPMNAIIGFNNIAKKYSSDPSLTRYLDKVGQASEHLLSLINDVLDMSRIESGKVVLNEKADNLPEIIQGLRNMVAPGMEQKNLQFDVECENIINENIICDRLRLNQVLLNMLSNAQKYTEKGYVLFKITQISESEDGYASYQFIVKDSGMGMSREFVKTLFEPFSREKNATVSGIQGTGLGMSIAKNIIDIMGGSISVETTEGVGTEFVYNQKFKIYGDDINPELANMYSDVRILVAEYDEESAKDIASTMSCLELSADYMCGEENILHDISEKHYDVYMLDWLIQNGNIFEIVREIRKNNEDAAIVIMTACDYGEVEQEAYDAGADMFISKPLFASSILDMLSRFYGNNAECAEDEMPDFTGIKLLLVEDNELNREIAAEILEEVGIIITNAENGLEAVNIISQAHEGDFDAVLMDIQMPVMNGYEATRKIRAMTDCPLSSIPIIAMTANAFEEDRKAALNAGMNEHLAKPVEVKKVYQTLSKLLKK